MSDEANQIVNNILLNSHVERRLKISMLPETELNCSFCDS